MKDHEIRGVVNELLTIAQTYGQSQQCRERIVHCLVPVLKNKLPRPQTNREAFEEYIKKHYRGFYANTFKRTAEGKYIGNAVLKTDPLEVIRVQHLWEIWNHGI